MQAAEKFKMSAQQYMSNVDPQTFIDCCQEALQPPRKTKGEKRPKGATGSGVKRGKDKGPSGFKKAKAGKGDAFGGGNPFEYPDPEDPWIGQLVERWWTKDEGVEVEGWVEAGITHFDEVTGDHCLVYDVGTGVESFEWFNVKRAFAGGEEKNIIRRKEGRLAVSPLIAPVKGVNSACQRFAEPGEVEGVHKGLQELEKMKQKLKEREEAIQEQLRKLDDGGSDQDAQDEVSFGTESE